MSPNASPESQSSILEESLSDDLPLSDSSSDETMLSSFTQNPGTVLRVRKQSHAAQILNKVLEEAENVEHAMLHMLHNAWDVSLVCSLILIELLNILSLGLPLFPFAKMASR